jgi:hypothetical protein
MGAKQHYVSKFHLREFCDPDSLSLRDPWVWLGSLSDNTVKRRAPKNIGTASGMFDGPGGFADRTKTIETHLAHEVEAPAAKALRELCSGQQAGHELPGPLARYLAWAASRSLTMRSLNEQWVIDMSARQSVQFAEPPPEGVPSAFRSTRPVCLVHPAHGETRVVGCEDASELLDMGWVPDMRDRENFLEAVHIQAYYFQVRWFPRFKWCTLRPPANGFFVLGDRALGWGVPGDMHCPPSRLRHPDAFMIAPLSRSLALLGLNKSTPWSITPSQVNALTAAWAGEWIVGPTEAVVSAALRTVVRP